MLTVNNYNFPANPASKPASNLYAPLDLVDMDERVRVMSSGKRTAYILAQDCDVILVSTVKD